MIMDFTGIGILAGLLLTVIGLSIFVIFAFAHAQKSRNDKPLAEQSAFRFLLVASIFLLINICVFLYTILIYENISYELRSALNGLMFFGWLPFNLFVIVIIAAILKKN